MKIQIKLNVNGRNGPGFRVIRTQTGEPRESWVDGDWPRDTKKALEEAVKLSGREGKEAFHVEEYLHRQLKRMSYAEINLPEARRP